MTLKRILFLAALLIAISAARGTRAAEFSSTNFKVLDPVFEIGGGGEMSSASFKLFGSIGEIAIGTSSASSFKVCSGSLCFSAPSAAAAEPTAAESTAAVGGGVLESILRDFFGARPIAARGPGCLSPADLNCDGKIGLADLSVFLYLLPRGTPNPADLNSDRTVNIRDLSVLFSEWTERQFRLIEERPIRTVRVEQPSPPTSFARQLAALVQPIAERGLGEIRGQMPEKPRFNWNGWAREGISRMNTRIHAVFSKIADAVRYTAHKLIMWR